ncbi:hypothetical protein [Algibacter agarivorans]
MNSVTIALKNTPKVPQGDNPDQKQVELGLYCSLLPKCGEL